MDSRLNRARRERGIILVSSLLLLIVITLIAVSMFRSFGLQERIAGNMREKHRAIQAAESAQQYAEWWLTSGANANTVTVCTGGVLNANGNQGQVCSNSLQSQVTVTTVPWTIASGQLGVDYTPAGMTVGAAGVNTYYAPPRFYIAQRGAYAGGNGTVYQIDSVGYGGTSESVAVI